MRATNSRNTDGDTSRWVCGACMRYYNLKLTTTKKGAKLKFSIKPIIDSSFPADTVIVEDSNAFDINQQVAAVQRGRGRL